MAQLKWLAIGLLSLCCGYFGHKLTGNWNGAAVGAVAVAVVAHFLLSGQWVPAVGTLILGVYLFFNTFGDGLESAERKRTSTPLTSSAGGGESLGALAGAAGKGAEAIDGVKAPQAEPGSKDAGAAKSETGAGAGSSSVLKDCQKCPELAVVAGGKFVMGRNLDQTKAGVAAKGFSGDDSEGPAHTVTVRSFAVGRFAVTRGQFAAFVGATGYQTDAERHGGCLAWVKDQWENQATYHWRSAGFAQTDEHPVVCVSWDDAQAYVQWLGKLSGQSYRLPSEAEREYSARAGSTTAFWWGDNLTPDQANYEARSTPVKGSAASARGAGTVPVNQFAANPFGLYNVHGNVWEWVQDCRHDTYVGAPVDGSAWTTRCTDNRRVLRGGGWAGDPAGLRVTSRGWFTPDFRFHAGGFRVARNLTKPK